MQGKGLVRFFLIALALVCLYQLSFTWITSNVEKDAEEYARRSVNTALIEPGADISAEELDSLINVINNRKRSYLDSIRHEVVYDLGVIDFTYQQAKQQELSLGLDLQGGMSVTLQINHQDMLQEMSNKSNDKDFLRALEIASESLENSQEDYITLFGMAFEEIAPGKRLSTIFATRAYQGRIDYNSTNEEVLQVIREESRDAVSRTYKILRTRIDRFGVTQPNIVLQERSGRIEVELPGVDDPARVRKQLQATANLEFWETYTNPEVYQYLERANKVIADKMALSDTSEAGTEGEELKLTPIDEGKEEVLKPLGDDTTEAGVDEESLRDADTGTSLFDELDIASVSDTADLSATQFRKQNPLFSVLPPATFEDETGTRRLNPGPVVGYAQGKDTAKVNKYLNMKEVQAVFPRNLKLFWSAKPISEDGDFYALYAIKTRINDDEPPLSGDVIEVARQDYDPQTGQPTVTMDMNSQGAQIWKRLTTQNQEKFIAIVLDNRVYSAPRVDEPISGGRSSISGDFTVREAKDLANIIEVGKLPVETRIIGEAIVGPSLGQESIEAGLISLIAGLVIVLLFMIFYYSGGGIIANIAVLLNMFFIFGILASLGATLTLPGIAGIVLTIGMSVDANVLIFERIREELSRGKGIRLAIIDGYRNSYSSILDANLTTLLTGIVLFLFGTGPILGFATVLIIGILSSLFTAILVTRLIVDWYISREKVVTFANKVTEGALQSLNVKFIGKRKIAYVFSSIIILGGIASFATQGFNFGVDFKGGRSYIIRFDQPVTTNEVRDALTDELENPPLVKTFGGENQVKITTSFLIDDHSANVDSIVEGRIFSGLKPMLNDDISYSEFINNYRMSSQKVGPTIADDIKVSAIWAMLFSLIGIFLYLLIRFRKWQYGLGAIFALFHDVLIVLTVFSIFKNMLPFSLEIDQAFIAAILTVIGYSINDTVVVFDRIREFLFEHRTKDQKEVVNMAINRTLSRTLITSVTTLIVILALFIFGGEVIRGFSFALLIGVLSGTYSSVFIATPVVVDFGKEKKK